MLLKNIMERENKLLQDLHQNIVLGIVFENRSILNPKNGSITPKLV
jgi:hypothetical protein